MAPPKAACQALATAQALWIELLDKYDAIRDALKKLLQLKLKLRFGGLDITDHVGAAILNTIAAVAATVADNIIGDVAQAGAALFEAIFASILKIILAFPTAIFSLVAIPQRRAILYAQKERDQLSRAQTDIETVMYLAEKWALVQGSDQYFNQMDSALPYINKAIELAYSMILELNGPPKRAGDTFTPYFDENKYSQLQSNLHMAIQLSQPVSAIADKLNLQQLIENDRQKIYNHEIGGINLEYQNRRLVISNAYQKQADNIPLLPSTTGSKLKAALKIEQARINYDLQLQKLDLWRTSRVTALQIKADTQSALNGSIYVKAIAGITGEFIYDMNTLINCLGDFYGSIKLAYMDYSNCRLSCNAAYNSKALIKSLLNEILTAIRQTSIAASDVIIKSIEASESLMEMARDKFQDAVNRYISSDKSISDCELVTSLTMGNQLLNVADSGLDATITKSVIDMINSPNILEDAGGEFDAFITDLSAIRDWDGALNIWAVDMLNGAPSPYIELIAEATSMLTKIPMLVTSRNAKNSKALNISITKVENLFKKAQTHNSFVLTVLYSYNPYVGSELGNLTALLAKVNLLDDFATKMSIASVAAKIISDVYNNGIDDIIPTYSTCNASYPELFVNPDLSKPAFLTTANNPSPCIDSQWQEKMEENMLAMMGFKTQLAGTNFDAGITDNDLNTGSA